MRRCAIEEFVVVLDGFPTGVEVAHGHGGRRGVDGGDLVAGPHVDAVGPVLFRGPGDEAVRRLHEPADQVGKAAGGVGRSGPALEGDDLEFVGRTSSAAPAPPRTSLRRHRR